MSKLKQIIAIAMVVMVGVVFTPTMPGMNGEAKAKDKVKPFEVEVPSTVIVPKDLYTKSEKLNYEEIKNVGDAVDYIDRVNDEGKITQNRAEITVKSSTEEDGNIVNDLKFPVEVYLNKDVVVDLKGNHFENNGCLYIEAVMHHWNKGYIINGGETGYGGAIKNSGSLEMHKVVIEDCKATYGGAIANVDSADELILDRVTIKDCKATYGGAIFNSSEEVLSNSIELGGSEIKSIVSLVVDGCEVTGKYSAGAAIYNVGRQLDISAITVTRCEGRSVIYCGDYAPEKGSRLYIAAGAIDGKLKQVDNSKITVYGGLFSDKDFENYVEDKTTGRVEEACPYFAKESDKYICVEVDSELKPSTYIAELIGEDGMDLLDWVGADVTKFDFNYMIRPRVKCTVFFYGISPKIVTTSSILKAALSKNLKDVFDTYKEEKYVEGSALTEPEELAANIEKYEGQYDFEGWYLFKDNKLTKFEFTEVGAELVYSDLCLIGKWRNHNCNVTFDPNNGSDTFDMPVEYGSTIGEVAEPTKEGYVFKGWKTEDNKFWNLDEEEGDAVTEDMTLTAYWAEGYSMKAQDIALSQDNFTFNGGVQKPVVKVAGLTEGKDYSVTYEESIYVGEYNVKVTGKGEYVGDAYVSYSINPVPKAIKKVSKGSKKLTVKWSKVKGIVATQTTGFQVAYSTNKDFSNAKYKQVSKKKTSLTIKKLKKNKKYYVKMRAYKVVGSKIFYSDWSSVKVKKTR